MVDLNSVLLRDKQVVVVSGVINGHNAALFALLEPGSSLVPHLLEPGHLLQKRLCVLHLGWMVLASPSLHGSHPVALGKLRYAAILHRAALAAHEHLPLLHRCLHSASCADLGCHKFTFLVVDSVPIEAILGVVIYHEILVEKRRCLSTEGRVQATCSLRLHACT